MSVLGPQFSSILLLALLASSVLSGQSALTLEARRYEIGDGCPRDAGKAWLLYQQAAKAGDPIAMVALGDMLDEGKCVDQDMGMALVWFRRASDLQNPVAMFRQARMYEQGRGTLRNQDEALIWYRQAASLKYGPALTRLGDLTLDLSWYRRAVEVQDPPAFAKLAELEPARAGELYHQGAELGDPASMYAVALGLEATDRPQAISLYKRSAEAGDPRAMKRYADFAEAQSQGEALIWYKKAAAAGEPASLVKLGLALESTNPDEAMRLYKRAVDAGYPPAMTRLGNLRADCELFQAAANLGDADGMFALATKCKDDPAWIRKAAAKGHAESLARIGEVKQAAAAGHVPSMIKQGQYQKAAEQGDPEGMRLFGSSFENREAGAIWIVRAAEKGNRLAMLEAAKREGGKSHWWEQAAKAGEPEALFRVGLFSRAADKGYPPAMVKVGQLTGDQSWFERAAALGYPNAYTRLGKLEQAAELGDPEAKMLLSERLKPREAYALLKQAADAGYAPAMTRLGDCHVSGRGTSRSELDGVAWYRRALEAGDEAAREKLRLLNKL